VIGITPDGIKKQLDKLKKAGKIRNVGATKKGYWEIIQWKDALLNCPSI
jgi:predicted HTH transcriptional regulator